MWLPGEVALPVSVFNVEPDDIVRNVVLVKARIHVLHIILVIVVPAALVVGQCEQGREGLAS